jgi:HK97 family phage prohead protease
MTIQHKAAAFELKKEPDDDGRFEGYASVFGVVDRGMDIVERGAFAKSLAMRKPKMLWQHDTEKVIGVWDEVAEDERGLFVKGRLLKDVSLGREAMALLRAGAIDSMSIGYMTKEAVAEANGRVRRLMDVELYEISLVTFPMNEAAQVTALKADATIRDWEGFLRDVGGLSHKEAKAFCAGGFKAMSSLRDVARDDGQNEGVSALLAQINRLQETFNARGHRNGG